MRLLRLPWHALGLMLGQACQLRQIVTAGGRGPVQIRDAKNLFNPFLETTYYYFQLGIRAELLLLLVNSP